MILKTGYIEPVGVVEGSAAIILQPRRKGEGERRGKRET